jgi:hypothetical protein
MNDSLTSIVSNLFVFFLICWAMVGCSGRNTGINIDLPENQHLEDHPAGWWIKELSLKYDHNSKERITQRVHNRLVARGGIFIDKYSKNKQNFVFVWEYVGLRKVFVVEEHYFYGEDSADLSITIPLEPPGITWESIIPNHCDKLKPNRISELAATIESKADRGARLFLYGWGQYCTRITLSL